MQEMTDLARTGEQGAAGEPVDLSELDLGLESPDAPGTLSVDEIRAILAQDDAELEAELIAETKRAEERARELERLTPEERAAHDELESAERVFQDIREQSADSALVTPVRWAELGLIPAHLTSQQFVDLIFDLLDRAQEKREAEAAAKAEASLADGGELADAPAALAPTDTDGAPAAEASDPAALTAPDPAAPAAPAAPSPEAAPESAASGFPTDLPAEARTPSEQELEFKRALFSLDCQDIVALEGKETMYLYSDRHMTDAYANWSFLAHEDDKVLTFVSVVREDSRVYPRPMIYRSLMNPPFNMTEDEILDIWKTVQESGEYPDIESCSASNDDVYFYSTEYLTPFYAKKLAELYSVERPMSM